jgi:hypothetical protein
MGSLSKKTDMTATDNLSMGSENVIEELSERDEEDKAKSSAVNKSESENS